MKPPPGPINRETTEKEDEIAHKLVAFFLKEEGLRHLKPNQMRQQLGNIAKDIDVDLEDLIGYLKPCVKGF